MTVSRVRDRVLAGLGANSLGMGIAVAVQVAGVPILLYFWGTRLYGEWLVLFAVPASLSLTNLGYSAAIGNDMTARVARGDRAGALLAFQSLISLVCVTGSMAFVAAILFVIFFPFGATLHLAAIGETQARWTVFLLACEVLGQLGNGVCAAGYRANGEYARGVVVTNLSLLGQYVGLWAAAALGWGVLGAASAFLGLRLVGTAANMAHLARRHQWLRFGVRRTQLAYLRNLTGPSLANLILPLGNALRNQGIVLVVNAILGPAAVVILSTLRTLSRVSLRVVTIVSNSTQPELAVAEAINDRARSRRLFYSGLQVSLLLSVAAGVGLWLGGGSILKLWTHGQVPMDEMLLAWLLASAATAALWHVSLSALQGVNRHGSVAVAYLLGATAAVGVVWALLWKTGRLANVGLAIFLSDGALAAFALKRVMTLSGSTTAELVRALTSPAEIYRLASGISLTALRGTFFGRLFRRGAQ